MCKFYSFLMSLFVLSFFAACSAPVNETDYSYLIRGHWSNTGVSDNVTQTLGIDYNGSGTIVYYDLVDNDWGIMAFGQYTLEGSIISATYTEVRVYDKNYAPMTYHGFTNAKKKTVNYSILSCDGHILSIIDENGDTQNYEKYADIKK